MLDMELDFLLAATHVAECSSGSFLLAALWYPCAALPSESLVHPTPEGPGGPGEHSRHGHTVESTPGTQERRVPRRPCSCSCSTYVRRQDHFPNLVAQSALPIVRAQETLLDSCSPTACLSDVSLAFGCRRSLIMALPSLSFLTVSLNSEKLSLDLQPLGPYPGRRLFL